MELVNHICPNILPEYPKKLLMNFLYPCIDRGILREGQLSKVERDIMVCTIGFLKYNL